MSLPGSVEQKVEKQAVDILTRANRGASTGTFSVSHLGPKLAPAVVSFALSSPEAERAYLRFVRASFNFERRRDQASQVKLAARVLHLDELVAKASLKADEATALRRELQHYLGAVRQVDEQSVVAAEKLRASLRGAKGVRAAVREVNVAREVLLAKTRVSFLDGIATLSHAGAVPSAADAEFLRAYRKFSQVLGADVGGGWKQAIEYMADNASAVKAYRAELGRLQQVIAKETDPTKLAHLRDKAYEAVRKSGVHSKLKGLLGELFIARWRDWRLIKSGYLDVAQRIATRLGRDWQAVPVAGRMFLGGAETWDEAVLIVRRGSNPPEAKLFMAAQIKVALEPASLNQTLNDIVREEARRDLRIVLPDGSEEFFLLTPLPAGEVPKRWVSNAAGGDYPLADIAKLFERRVQVHQQAMPITLDEFNAVADRLLKACADLL